VNLIESNRKLEANEAKSEIVAKLDDVERKAQLAANVEANF
jgi:hypothetical protein